MDKGGQPGSAEGLATIGFSHVHAEDLSAKAALGVALQKVLMRQRLTMPEAATLCGSDQAVFSDALQGRLEDVTLGTLAGWLATLGLDVEITVQPAPEGRHGRLHVTALQEDLLF